MFYFKLYSAWIRFITKQQKSNKVNSLMVLKEHFNIFHYFARCNQSYNLYMMYAISILFMIFQHTAIER